MLCKILRACEIKRQGSPFWVLCRALHICVHVMLFHIVSHDFTAPRNVQRLKQRDKLYTSGVFWSVFLIRVFDLPILFEALSSSFPPHFNKDKTESTIVAAKSLSHENTKSFMSSAEWKIKLIYFCSLWIWDNIACLKHSLCCVFECVCACVALHIHFIISVAVECVLRICVFCLSKAARL